MVGERVPTAVRLYNLFILYEVIILNNFRKYISRLNHFLGNLSESSKDDNSGDGSGNYDNTEDESSGGIGDSSDGSGDEYQEGRIQN